MSFNVRARTRMRRTVKIILALLLVLLFLSFLIYLYLQRYIIYSDTGARMEITPEYSAQPPNASISPNLIILSPQPSSSPTPTANNSQLEKINAFYVSASDLSGGITKADLDYNLAYFGCGALMLDMKPGSGILSYTSSLDAAVSAGASGSDTSELINQLGSVYTIAQISCLCDDTFADSGNALVDKNGAVWQDESEQSWLDPTKEECLNYIVSVSREIANMGFHEIVFTDLCYPTTGSVNSIAYTTEHSPQVLTDFAQKLTSSLSDLNIVISFEPESAESGGSSGQQLDKLVSYFKRFYLDTDDTAELSVLSGSLGIKEGLETALVQISDNPAADGYGRVTVK